MTSEDEIKKLKEALKVAAEAFSIVSEWNIDEMELKVPEDWNLDTDGLEEGWYRMNDLSSKFRQLSN